jgi:hypothetical protein
MVADRMADNEANTIGQDSVHTTVTNVTNVLRVKLGCSDTLGCSDVQMFRNSISWTFCRHGTVMCVQRPFTAHT